jgi:hypothetical protein
MASNNWRELVSNVGTIAYFSWSSDSNYVYFDNLLTNDPAIFAFESAIPN